MNAISLWQPWASLCAIGAKPFETRDYPPPPNWIGKPIAIHAAKKVAPGAGLFAQDLMYGQYNGGGALTGFDLADALEASWQGAPDHMMGIFGEALMPVGCVVCTAVLDAAFLLGEPAKDTAVPASTVVRRLTSRPMPECFTVRCDDFGDYAPDRWAWLLRDVKPLRPPVPAIGRQKFFVLPPGWMTETFFGETSA